MAPLPLLVTLLASAIQGSLAATPRSTLGPRTTYSLDRGWKFVLEGSGPVKPCAPHTWTTTLDGKQTLGLAQASAITEPLCAAQCCAEPSCETYQFCNSSTCGSGPPQQASCWIGKYTGAKTVDGKGWIGAARTVAPPPSPSPSPSPSGCDAAWCRPSTDDTKWRDLDIPHDFVVEVRWRGGGVGMLLCVVVYA